jgi:hypothetical protein
MKVVIDDQLGNEHTLEFGWTTKVGEVRNALNSMLAPGYGVLEMELVPAPFARYMHDVNKANGNRGEVGH